MFRRLLVANRGEIAVRILGTCRAMGLPAATVYSDADRLAPHVLAAERAVHIGPAAPGESYLNIDRVIDAARRSGCDAVHPGYGFLSESPALALACQAAGLTFVGPPPDAIQRMGSKIEARRQMQEAGVPVVPGETPALQDDDAIVASATRVGWPVLVKPSAGGGGIGMRVIPGLDHAAAAIRTARREAEAAFGDGTLYVERYLEAPRHVEVQVFGDARGRIVHLFERECSIQRRHQKVIEECPSPAVSEALRARLGEAAVAAAAAVGYRNAGTVEFLLDGDPEGGRFYFLEMNTRLQVEHPVTEMVLGVDLVAAQILAAAGEPVPWIDDPPTPRGHAIECRIYAEDPARDFLPQAGHVLLYRPPGGPGLRVDSGIGEGSDIPIHYDPLVAKLTAHGETRTAALGRARDALTRFPILGVQTNIALLTALLSDADVVAGRTDTGLLHRKLDRLLDAAGSDLPLHVAAAAAVAGEAVDNLRARRTDSDPWRTLTGWRG